MELPKSIQQVMERPAFIPQQAWDLLPIYPFEFNNLWPPVVPRFLARKWLEAAPPVTFPPLPAFPTFLPLPPEEVPPVPPPAKAILEVRTVPVLGEVYLNGVYQGSAPIDLELDPGIYTVSFGDVQGYVTPLEKSIAVAEGETKRLTSTYQEITEVVPPPLPPEEEPPVLPPAKAILEVRTVPVSGPVYLNGVYQSYAPIELELEPGALYSISFGDVEGYMAPISQSVRLSAGETTTLTAGYSEIAPPVPPAMMKGDADGDGHVTWPDFVAFSDAYESKLGDPNYNPIMDFNDDGVIDILDFAAFSDVYKGTEPLG